MLPYYTGGKSNFIVKMPENTALVKGQSEQGSLSAEGQVGVLPGGTAPWGQHRPTSGMFLPQPCNLPVVARKI